MSKKNDNTLNNFGYYEKKEYILEKQNREKDHINLIAKSLDIEYHAKDIFSTRTSQDRLLQGELSSFLKEVSFSNQELLAWILVSNIKYHYLELQNNNPFYRFHD